MSIKTFLSGDEALENRRIDGTGSFKYPQQGDDRVQDGLIFPRITPSFQLEAGMTAFTIGSCFAREIEAKLTMLKLPTTTLSLPQTVVPGRDNSVINEFNPGCISQRIRWAVAGQDTREFLDTISLSGDKGKDLLLAKGHTIDVDELLNVRALIDNVYAAVPVADILIVTLGMTQTWQDTRTGIYLNRMPSPRDLKREPDRYVCRFLTVRETVDLLRDALDRAFDAGTRNAILTVSPVPLQQTFQNIDCVIANSHSKATLRVAATEIETAFAGRVDYFPSYEIVQSGGLAAFQDDHIHVRRNVVERITSHMVSHYLA